MKALTMLTIVVVAGCLQPLRRYAIGPIAASADATTQLARAMTAAGLDVVEVDPRLAVVSSRWIAPFGNDWQRRVVATVAPDGLVTLRMDVQICRLLYEPCTPVNGGNGYDLEALDAVAADLGRSLQAPVRVLP